MEAVEFSVKGKKSLQLSVFKIEPEGKPKGIIQIFHGMGEHKDRYLGFGMFLAENGYAVYCHDHRKHGKSIENPEDLGIFHKEETWVDVIDDCYLISRQIKKDHPKVPITVLGHSMGSIIARYFLSKYEGIARAAIIMGPPPKMGRGQVMKAMLGVRLMKLLTSSKKPNNFLAEQLNKMLIADFEEPRTKFDWLCTDEGIVDAYLEDPLCGFAYNPRFYQEFFTAADKVTRVDKYYEINDLPLLFIGGGKDPVGENGEAVKQMRGIYSGFAFVQLAYKLFPDMRHEILNETDKQEVYDFLLKWLDKNIE